MEKQISLGPTLIVLFLLAVLGFYLFSIFHTEVPEDTHYVKYGTIRVEFRSMISDCYAIDTEPEPIRRTFTNPLVQRIVILMDPFEDAFYVASLNDVYRMTTFMGKNTVYAFTNATDSDVDVLTIDDATVEAPIVFLNVSGHTDIRPFENGVILNAEDHKSLDSVACRFGLALMGDPRPA